VWKSPNTSVVIRKELYRAYTKEWFTCRFIHFWNCTILLCMPCVYRPVFVCFRSRDKRTLSCFEFKNDNLFVCRQYVELIFFSVYFLLNRKRDRLIRLPCCLYVSSFQLSNQLITCHETWHEHIQLELHANAIIFISLQSVIPTSRTWERGFEFNSGATQTTAFARHVDNTYSQFLSR
jgi:hypothetical protein